MTMRLAIVAWFLGLLLIPLVAYAEDAAPSRQSWGEGSNHSYIQLDRCAEPVCEAMVTFHNELTTPPDEHKVYDLQIERAKVTVFIDELGGRAPDTFRVMPPPGFNAEPSEITVQDGGEGTILLIPIPMG